MKQSLRRRWPGALGVVVVVLGGGVSSGEVVLLTQERTAVAKSWDFSVRPHIPHDESWAAADFGLADVTLHPLGDMGYARHVSTLGATQIEAASDAYGRRGYQSWHGGSEVKFLVTFRVDTPVTYRWAGSWMETAYAGGRTALTLTGPGVDLVYQRDTAQGIFDGVFDVSGVLAAGVYTLTANTSGRPGGVGLQIGYGGYNFTLSVPGPGAMAVVAPMLVMAARRRRS